MSEPDASHEADASYLAFLTRSTGDPTIDTDLEYIRKLDWASSTIGPICSWPSELLVLVNLAMLSPQPQLFLLGTNSILLYNTAYGRLLRDHHPQYQGRPMELNTALIAQAPTIERIVGHAETGDHLANENHVLFFFLEEGRLQEVFLSATMVQLPLSLQGFHATTYDTTLEHVRARREKSLDLVRNACACATTLPTLWPSIIESISLGDSDIAFAVVYRTDSRLTNKERIDTTYLQTDSQTLLLAGTAGSFPSQLPSRLTSQSRQPWVERLFECVASKSPQLLRTKDGTLPQEMRQASRYRCYGDECQDAMVLPSALKDDTTTHAVLIIGLAPRRPYDEAYQAWIRALHQTFANTVTSIAIADATLLAKANDKRRTERESKVLAKELLLREQEAVIVAGKMQRMLRIMEASSVGVFECDPSGEITQANNAFYDLGGFSDKKKAHKKMLLSDLCEPESMDVLRLQWQSLIAGRPTTLSMRFCNRDGDEGKWVQVACVPVLDASFAVVSITGCVTDIDAQKKVEQEAIKRAEALEKLHLSEARLLKFIANAPLGIVIFDRNKRPSFVNETWIQLTGHPAVSTEEVDVRSVIFPEDISLFDDYLDEICKGERSVSLHVRLKRLWSGGTKSLSEQTWVSFTAFQENIDGSGFQITTTMTDISDFKFAESMQRLRLEEAVEARRQQENFVDMTSHEIRNPLTAVMHCTDLLSQTISETKQLFTDHCSTATKCGDKDLHVDQLNQLTQTMVDAVETIMACTIHQKRITDDILSLSKLDSNLLEICPTIWKVDKFIGQMENIFKIEAAQAGVQLTATSDPSLQQLGVDWVEADSGRLMQVIVNLVTNAIKFTKDQAGPKMVAVCIGASLSPSADMLAGFIIPGSGASQSEITTKFTSDEFYLCCSVEDTGCGMDAAGRTRIFSRFTQASPKTYNKYGGSGLGLFISQKLASLQGGQIGYKSEKDVGSTFAVSIRVSKAVPNMPSPLDTTSTITIPAEENEHSTQVGNSKSSRIKGKPPLRILLVEDNMINQKVLSTQLRHHGYIVYTADNGQDAFDFIKTTEHWSNSHEPEDAGPAIDVILMDIEMPIVDGLECASLIRSAQRSGLITKHLPIIAVTANARPEQLKRAVEVGMDDAITKPFRVQDLMLVISRLGLS